MVRRARQNGERQAATVKMEVKETDSTARKSNTERDGAVFAMFPVTLSMNDMERCYFRMQ